MTIDYDQLLAKQPHKDDAVFAWHQDMAYWPDTPDRRTATFWLAVDDSTLENGCMRFVPATNHEAVAAAARAGVRRAGHVTCARHRPARRRRGGREADRARRLHGAQRAGDARLGRKPHWRVTAVRTSSRTGSQDTVRIERAARLHAQPQRRSTRCSTRSGSAGRRPEPCLGATCSPSASSRSAPSPRRRRSGTRRRLGRLSGWSAMMPNELPFIVFDYVAAATLVAALQEISAMPSVGSRSPLPSSPRSRSPSSWCARCAPAAVAAPPCATRSASTSPAAGSRCRASFSRPSA